MRNYITKSGDTWDKVAAKVYKLQGGEKLTTTLIEANPDENLRAIFGAGTRLIVPDVYYPASNSLPPWVRA